MGRKLGRILVWTMVLLLIVAGLAAAAAELRWKRTFDAPYPDLHASTDPAVIEAGKTLVYGPAGCAYCHLPREEWDRLDAGATPPLTGNHRFPLPFGTVYSRNLTPDAETGIGKRTDGELARILRYGVRHDGRAAAPLMAFHGMSDEDLVAAISYLRTQPAVAAAVPEHDLNLLGKALMAFVIAPPPVGEPRLVASPPTLGPDGAPNVERGRYLVENVATCGDCHTDRNRKDGARYSGGEPMDSGIDPAHFYVPPNLTSDPKTGRIYGWNEATFLRRFRAGKTYPMGVMPWGAFGRLSDDDLRAIFRFLRSVPPVEHASGPAVVKR